MDNPGVNIWQAIGCSQVGSAHVRRRSVNQDHLNWRVDQTGARLLAAVADGHGSAPHFRSDVGSRLATEAALDCLEAIGDERPDAQRIAETITSRWSQRVREHLAGHPYLPPNQPSDELVPYGSTLIAAAATSRWLVIAQIGDGDCHLACAGQPIRRITTPQDELVGEQTLSLCLEAAASQFSIQLLDLDWLESPPEFLSLSTDGVGKSFPPGPSFGDALEQFRKLCQDPGRQMSEVAAGLPGWLNDVSEHGSGDDATLLLAARRVDAIVW